jgi:2-dehydropantoate 2-reductase
MRVAVVGTGGVGGYFGGRLAQAGHEVHFIARGPHLDAIRRDGLRVDSINGDFVVKPALATNDPAEVGPVDAVIVAVKTWQLDEAARAARPLVGPDTVVLPLLNGVEASDRLGSALGAEHVLGGLCRLSAEIAGPGHVRHTAVDPSMSLGERDNGRSRRIEALTAALVGAGVKATIAADIDVALWEKFMFIATWSGIGAVTRVPLGEWRAVPGLRSMAEAALQEVVAVARARGVRFSEDRISGTMAAYDAAPPHTTASMQRDIQAGRPSELEAQNGAVVRLGTNAGVPTPTHAFLYHSLIPQEAAARMAPKQAGGR